MALSFSRTGKISLSIPDAGKSCETWYGIVGDLETDGIPLILAHGGPGAGHNYLTPLSKLHTDYGVPLIFYDQLGCGKSTPLPHKAGDESFWSVELFINELLTLVKHFSLQDTGFDFYGQSWGGMLGGAFASLQPLGLRKLILADSPASVPLMQRGVEKLIAALPKHVQQVLKEADETKNWDSEQYKEACMVFYKKHLCRLDEWPDCLNDSMGMLEEDPTVYRTMWGPSELTPAGNLREYECFSTAHKIDVETLLINGRYDEVQDVSVEPFFHEIPKVKWVVLEKSSHMGHLEEPDRYVPVISEFLGYGKL